MEDGPQLIFSRRGGLVRDNLGRYSPAVILRCAINAPEEAGLATGDCTVCLGNGSCPLETDQWYSDTTILSIGDRCPPASRALMPSVVLNPEQIMDLNAFTLEPISNEVCRDNPSMRACTHQYSH